LLFVLSFRWRSGFSCCSHPWLMIRSTFHLQVVNLLASGTRLSVVDLEIDNDRDWNGRRNIISIILLKRLVAHQPNYSFWFISSFCNTAAVNFEFYVLTDE
jgi:hypothetical protein